VQSSTTPLSPTGFWSYTSSDATSSRGRLSQLRRLLADELQLRLGRAQMVHIFQDVAAIPHGTDWRKEIHKALVASSFLIRQVGEKRTRELLLTGRLLRAHEAQEIGLVTQIVAAEELLQTAQALAQTLLLNSPQAMHAVKCLLAKHARRRLDEELEDAIQANSLQRSAEDFREGVEAFRQHRRPDWPSMKVKV